MFVSCCVILFAHGFPWAWLPLVPQFLCSSVPFVLPCREASPRARCHLSRTVLTSLLFARACVLSAEVFRHEQRSTM